MGIVDIVIILAIIIFTYLGARRGLVNELLGPTGWIVSFLVALAFCDFPASLLIERFPRLGIFSTLVSIIAILFIVRILIQVLANYIHNMMGKKADSFANYFGGSVLGFIQGLFILSVLVLSIAVFPFKATIKSIDKDSVLYNHVAHFSVYIVETIAKYVPKTKTAVDALVNKLEKKTVGETTNTKAQVKDTVEKALSEEELEKIIQNELKKARSKGDLRR